MDIGETMCCNVLELQFLNDTTVNIVDMIKDIARECDMNMRGISGPNKGAAWFSVAWDPKPFPNNRWKTQRLKSKYLARYKRFCKYIEDNDLGRVIQAPASINPNHGSYVKMGFWLFNQVGFRAWCVEKRIMIDNRGGW